MSPKDTKLQSFAGKSKEEAVTATENESVTVIEDESASGSGRLGKTVFVDVSQFGRKKKAAKGMTELHEHFAQEGWTLPGTARVYC